MKNKLWLVIIFKVSGLKISSKVKLFDFNVFWLVITSLDFQANAGQMVKEGKVILSCECSLETWKELLFKNFSPISKIWYPKIQKQMKVMEYRNMKQSFLLLLCCAIVHRVLLLSYWIMWKPLSFVSYLLFSMTW